jgi:GNAT superfamily N-acetyltransferase
MHITKARPDDAKALTEIAFAAKRYWGYPARWLSRWRNVVTVAPDYITKHPTYAAVVDDEIVGFYAIEVKRDEAHLEHLWVAPRWIGKGVGRSLFAHAEEIAIRSGAVRMTIESDPNAEGFYRRMGARVSGRKPVFMDSHKRYLPLLKKVLSMEKKSPTRRQSQRPQLSRRVLSK